MLDQTTKDAVTGAIAAAVAKYVNGGLGTLTDDEREMLVSFSHRFIDAVMEDDEWFDDGLPVCREYIPGEMPA